MGAKSAGGFCKAERKAVWLCLSWQCLSCLSSWGLQHQPQAVRNGPSEGISGAEEGLPGVLWASACRTPDLETALEQLGQAGMFPGRDPGCSHPLCEGRDEPSGEEFWLLRGGSSLL